MLRWMREHGGDAFHALLSWAPERRRGLRGRRAALAVVLFVAVWALWLIWALAQIVLAL